MKTSELLEAVSSKKSKVPKWKGKYRDLHPSEKARVSSEFADGLEAMAKAAKDAVDLLYNGLLYAADTTDDAYFESPNRGLAGMTNSLHAIVGEMARLSEVFKKEQKTAASRGTQKGAPWE